MAIDKARTNLEDLIRTNGDDFASVSRMLGKNPAYIQQFKRRGSPRKLDEQDRRRLAEFYGVDEQLLGGPGRRYQSGNPSTSTGPLVPIRKLQVGASAGAGTHAEDDFAETIGFGPQWLKRLGADPGQLSLVQVDGDSMDPTLCDGDDIMVDHGAARRHLRDGIYVLRMDDVLLVKRVAIAPSGACRSEVTIHNILTGMMSMFLMSTSSAELSGRGAS